MGSVKVLIQFGKSGVGTNPSFYSLILMFHEILMYEIR